MKKSMFFPLILAIAACGQKETVIVVEKQRQKTSNIEMKTIDTATKIDVAEPSTFKTFTCPPANSCNAANEGIVVLNPTNGDLFVCAAYNTSPMTVTRKITVQENNKTVEKEVKFYAVIRPDSNYFAYDPSKADKDISASEPYTICKLIPAADRGRDDGNDERPPTVYSFMLLAKRQQQ